MDVLTLQCQSREASLTIAWLRAAVGVTHADVTPLLGEG